MVGLEPIMVMHEFVFLSQVDKNRCLSWSNKTAPCVAECPINLDIEDYIDAAAKGDFNRGLDIILKETPFAGVLGRVCSHPCEAVCRRSEVDEAISIRGIKRFLADYGRQNGREGARQEVIRRNGSAGIVGSGPAGLSCAYDLAREGFAVTIYEAESKAGGWMRYGIPHYRLPPEVLDYEIGIITDLGVEIKLNKRIGKDIQLGDLREQHDALFLATGAWESAKIDIEGSDLRGVYWGTDFLKRINSDDIPVLNGTVIVIGGGNVAVDAALTAQRLGAKKVSIFCLETEEQMPAFRDEIELAMADGVQINNNWGLQKIEGENGSVTGAEIVRCRSVFDDNGDFNPVFCLSETQIISADSIILAIGQIPDVNYIGAVNSIQLKKGLIQCDPVTLETESSGIFAGGDGIYGPGSVVRALASGKQAAISIMRYISKTDLREGRLQIQVSMQDCPVAKVPVCGRVRMPEITGAERRSGFSEVELGFDKTKLAEEAARCLRCYTCHRCTDNWSCSAFLFKENGAKFSPVIDSTLCEGCGVCAANCPYNSVILGGCVDAGNCY